uniref:Uncharacterized protein n=1 Tax=viral metagenome TaxID=1070528 RepID=A0A6H1ZBQ2_9ZZZZ
MKTSKDIFVPLGSPLETIPTERRQALMAWAGVAVRVEITRDIEGILLIGNDGLGQLIENGLVSP